MTGPEALSIIDQLLEQHQHGTLKTIQVAILLQVWKRDSYQEIGSELGYEPEYVKKVAAQLWRLLSELVGEKVCKGNLCSILENYQRSLTITDWGEASDVSLFYGRQAELETLEDWIIDSRCRLVGIFGWGGIGKTALSVKLARRLESRFEYVVWRSLRHAPILNDLLAEILPIFTASREQLTSIGVERSRTDAQVRKSSLGLLMKQLREQRCLLVLDHVESILQQGDARCSYLSGYEEYGEMFDRISAERHQSCTILTGREKPQGMMQREGVNLPVRSIQLTGMSIAAAQHILIDKGLESPQLDREELICYVGGNPLMLKLVATTVQNLFSGDIMAFLTEGTGVFSNLQDLFAQQFARLSPLQQQVMYWLAINREGVTLARLKAEFLPAITVPTLLAALETLKDRSAILLCRRCANETTDRGLTQQPTMMEYVTDRFIQEID
jgi:NB-ARC domain